jgi:hypothetical protein
MMLLVSRHDTYWSNCHGKQVPLSAGVLKYQYVVMSGNNRCGSAALDEALDTHIYT